MKLIGNKNLNTTNDIYCHMMSDEVDKTPNIDLNETDAVTVRFKKTIIAKMDELTEKKGFRNKQDLIREAVRKYLEEIA
jgi:hypothetical protein